MYTVAGIYCNATWDGLTCWPATHAGETVELPCPPFIPLDQTSKFKHFVRLEPWQYELIFLLKCSSYDAMHIERHLRQYV